MKRIVGYDSQETGKMAYSTSEAQIEHELNSLADKVSLLKSTDGPQRQELLRACKEAIPRLFQLANSDLSEPLMRTYVKPFCSLLLLYL